MSKQYGLHFPIVIDSGSAVDPDLLSSIHSSLLIILGWIYGKRFFNYPFGSILYFLLTTPGSESNISIMKTYIRLAISRNEQRITIQTLDVVLTGENMKMTVKAIVNSTQSEFEFDTFL